MKHQLVLQFPETIMSYEEMVELEESLIPALRDKASVDGHDVGAGEVNLFVLTDDPKGVFKTIMGLLDKEMENNLKAAYRETGSERYVILWPKNLKQFKIK